jgi:ribose transport system ATP-binding protein
MESITKSLSSGVWGRQPQRVQGRALALLAWFALAHANPISFAGANNPALPGDAGDRPIQIAEDLIAGAPASVGTPLLSVAELSKQFGGTQALDRVSLLVHGGEILALLGENGAGKSTLIKILAGIHAPDGGHVSYRGQPVAAARRMPIAFIHQDLGLIDWMTVAENVCLTLGYPRRLGLVDWTAARRRARAALDLLGADIDPDTRINTLTRMERSLVAVARGLAAEAELLVLDEPTASLPTGEVARLFTLLRGLRDRGMGMIYVSHRLDEVFELADRMVVLRDGRVAGERMVAKTTPEETILLIVGREPAQVFRRPPQRAGQARLALSGLCSDWVGPVDLDLHGGEVVGLVGLRGAGQERVGRALFGVAPITGGRILLDGAALAPASPRQAMAAGIDLVCGDRSAESLLPGRSIRENMFVNPLAAGRGMLSLIGPGREGRSARELGLRVGLRPNDPSLPIEALSGGNQQKVVVGRWLHLQGQVYVFEDPTAGVDVGAKAEIYRLFDIALAAGAAILIVSGDFEEVAKICHRAMVFDRGRVVAELDATALSVENLLAAASAGTAPHTC